MSLTTRSIGVIYDTVVNVWAAQPCPCDPFFQSDRATGSGVDLHTYRIKMTIHIEWEHGSSETWVIVGVEVHSIDENLSVTTTPVSTLKFNIAVAA
jgi:hypothetical protein